MFIGVQSRTIVVVAVLVLLGITGGVATAQDPGRGIDPNQGKSLVEVSLPSKGAALRLQLEADSYGVEFNDHYLRHNGDGSVTVTVFGTQGDIDALADAGYDIGATIEGPAIWRERIADRRRPCARRTAPSPRPRASRLEPCRIRTRS